ncbi:hypothetical protein EMEDMD4_170024 [Sinorhizobium medicae]|uniref:Uncharacterized protein n=1 Tax=Sinorhizobium medicae TaxID=110321 RepID=A0A508WXY3_9HYPH|nr:hypothetical protein EMEDMD4_170024 [Sinorhizobium medicae]
MSNFEFLRKREFYVVGFNGSISKTANILNKNMFQYQMRLQYCIF